jgi:hypothetical protein
MNWIYKYRLNPHWFFPTDESDSEKTNREEIFLLIKNHDRLIDSKLENRDAKISHLVGEEYTDPLISLNPYLDALYGKIDMTMDMPNIVVYYTETITYPDGTEKINMMSKSVSAQTIIFETIEEMSKWIDETIKYEEIFIYQIQPSNVFSPNKFGLRFGSVSKKLNILKGGSRKKKTI